MRTFYKFKGKNIKKSCDHAGGPGLFSFSSGEWFHFSGPQPKTKNSPKPLGKAK